MITVITDVINRNQDKVHDNILGNRSRFGLTTELTRTLCLMVTWLWTFSFNAVLAQPRTSHPCLTANAIAVMQSLQSWRGEYVPSSFETLIETISKETKIPIWIDRRIQKDLRIDEKTLNANDSLESLESFLNRIAVTVHASIAILDGVLAICPEEMVEKIESVHWRLNTSPGSKLAKQESFQWMSGETSDTIWRSFCERFDIKLSESVALEHDVWKAFSFERVPLETICICLLSGFDFTLIVENGSWQVVRLSTIPIDVKWTYKSDELKKLGVEHTRSWRKRWASVEISQPENMILAPVKAHRELVRPLMQLKSPSGKPKTSDYKGRLTGDLSGDLEIAIRSIGAKTKIEFFPLPLPPQIASKQIVVQLKNSSLDEALELISKAGGIQFRKAGNRIEILLQGQ